MTGYTLVIICMLLEYVGEKNVPVFVLFLLFHWNMPVLLVFAVYFLESPLNQFTKSMEVVVQIARRIRARKISYLQKKTTMQVL